ncbi:hypothetical protein B296_00051027, partial [Ensete ventricosum]
RQPLWANDAALHDHLVRRPAHRRCAHRRPPLQVATPVGIALQAATLAGGFPCRRLAPAWGLGRSQPPLQGAWPWPAATARGMAVADRYYKEPGRGPLPLSLLPSLRKCSKNA